MSLEALAWAFRQEIPAGGTVSPSNAKLVLLALANYSDADQLSFPSVARISSDTQLGESTVRRAIDALAAAGFLVEEKRRRANGTMTSSLYRLSVVQAVPGTVASEQTVTGTPLEPVTTTSETVTSRAPRKRDAVYDALILACGIDYDQVPSSKRRGYGVKVQELREIWPGVDELDFEAIFAECSRRAANYRLHFDSVLTPPALVGQWPICANPPLARGPTRLLSPVDMAMQAARRARGGEDDTGGAGSGGQALRSLPGP